MHIRWANDGLVTFVRARLTSYVAFIKLIIESLKGEVWMIIEIVQVIIATVLFFVMMFGIGFILNMLLKTTWFPIILFFVVLIAVAIWSPWDESANPTLSNFGTYTLVYYIPITGALIGAYVSGWAIRALRKGGYKMF